MNRGTPTPEGESAVSAGQASVRPAQEGTPVVEKTGEPVPGPTPVGESTKTAPPAPDPVDPKGIAARRLQSVRNLALLARTAIGNGYVTMQADPKMIADVCMSYEEKLGTPNEPSIAPAATAPDPTALPAMDDARTINALRGTARSSAQLTGADVSIWHNDRTGETWLVDRDQENPDPVQGWRRLYTAQPAPAETVPETPSPSEEFRGPGQAAS
jgi:hypothetical protein